MRPTQTMYATQGEWQEALIKWMDEDPTLENGKQFLIFEGNLTAEDLMFEGDMLEFTDCYFSADEWCQVIAFAEDWGHIVVVEGDDRWDDLQLMLDEAEEPEDNTWYDAQGNESETGLYDAGGHINSERLSEWADDYLDRMRDKDVP